MRSGPPRGPRCLAPRRWISAALCVKLVRQVELTSCEMFPCSRAEVVVDESRTLANVFLMLKVCTNSIPPGGGPQMVYQGAIGVTDIGWAPSM